jgi:ectoine hydroxylase-related dioxygenase (phytanoyl-CoA dioxygenase family)
VWWSKPKRQPPKCFYEALPTYAPTETDRMLQAMRSDGFVLIPAVLRASEVQESREKIDGLTPIHWDYTGLTDHYKNVFNRDPFWLSFLDRNGVIDVAEASLGGDCHVIGETAWRSHPGHCGVGLHLDYLPMEWPEPGVPEGVHTPMFLCTAHFYLSPQTEELCPTYVIPGSHRAGRRPGRMELQWNGRLSQPVLCDAGDVLFFRSDLWHSGSENRTPDQVRYLLQVHYGRRETAQHFAPYLEWRFNREVVAACNPRQRRLLGDHRQGAYD